MSLPGDNSLDCANMHAAWLDYCEAGIDYLRERVFPWWGKKLDPNGTIKSRKDLKLVSQQRILGRLPADPG